MRRICFYVCPVCGNVIAATASAQVTCCSRPLEAIRAQPMDEAHRPTLEAMDGEWYAAFHHPMEKGHYIRFVACVRFDRVMLVRLYPEQGAELCLPQMGPCTLVVGCSDEGLFQMKI